MATPLTSTHTAPQNSLHLHAALRKAGLRPTFHRLYVLRVLDSVAPALVTAEQVFQKLGAMEVDVSQATVYRALNEIEQRGLLVRSRLQDASDNKMRYAVAASAPAAATCVFACPVCGQQSAIADAALCDQLQRQALAAGFAGQPDAIAVQVTCRQCG